MCICLVKCEMLYEIIGLFDKESICMFKNESKHDLLNIALRQPDLAHFTRVQYVMFLNELLKYGFKIFDVRPLDKMGLIYDYKTRIIIDSGCKKTSNVPDNFSVASSLS